MPKPVKLFVFVLYFLMLKDPFFSGITIWCEWNKKKSLYKANNKKQFDMNSQQYGKYLCNNMNF